MVSHKTVVLRALNYLRSVHLPSYVALRLLLESTCPRQFSALIDGLIDQVTIRKTDRFLELKRFKSVKDSDFVYRNYSVPSPTAAIADCYALAVIQQQSLIPRRSYVYSYRVSEKLTDSKSFEYFANGYRERNVAIADALERTGGKALVADLQGFYPNVDGLKALEALKAKLLSCDNISKRDFSIVMATASRALASHESQELPGLRVGPEFTHILADISLSQVDERLSTKYPGRYFRYVDDIVIVSDSESISDISNDLSLIVDEEGFKRNPTKDAVVGLDEWKDFLSVSDIFSASVSKQISSLKFLIKVFLARNPEKIDLLRSSLADISVFLPLEQLLDGAFDKRWRERFFQFIANGWKVAFLAFNADMDFIVRRASETRDKVIEELNVVLGQGIPAPTGDIDRKWKVQKARYVINRSLYFSGREDLLLIKDYASHIPELAEVEAVCAGLLGDFSLVVKMPGNAVSVCAQLARFRGLTKIPSASEVVLSGDPVIVSDVIAQFGLQGFDMPQIYDGMQPDQLGLVKMALGLESNEDFGLGYGAEVFAIGSQSSRDKKLKMASTRYSQSEDIVLDALSLGSGYFS